MSKTFGYARVSTTDQDLTIQHEALVRAGVPAALIFSEKASGTKTKSRPELARVLAIVGNGDVLIVTRIDRLARSMKDFVTVLSDLKARGVGFRCTEQAIDTSGAAGELTMNILAAAAQFETQLRRERQMEGIVKAKAEGKYMRRGLSPEPSAANSPPGRTIWALPSLLDSTPDFPARTGDPASLGAVCIT